MSAVQESFEALSVRLADSEERDSWAQQSEAINQDIQDIMVDVLVVFLQLPKLDTSLEAVEAWATAFDRLFEIVPGLKPVFNTAPLEDLETRFEGRPGRFYSPIEEEYFLATFFQDFWQMLLGTDKLGDLAVGSTLADPRDDLINVYEFVKERKKGSRNAPRRRSRRELALRDPIAAAAAAALREHDKVAANDPKSASRAIEKHLMALLDAYTDADSAFDRLELTALAVESLETSQVGRFFLKFKRQEFALLYASVRDTLCLLVLVDVLTKYYMEFQAEPHLFNAPDYGTFIKDLKRSYKNSESRTT